MKKAMILIMLGFITSIVYSISDGMVVAAENEHLKLFYNPETAEVALEMDGSYWFTNPPDRDEDSLVNDLNFSRLSSQAKITIYNSQDQKLEMDSYTHSVLPGNFSMNLLPEGIRVEYRMDNYQGGMEDIPLVIEKHRFETRFLGQMNSADRALFEDRYYLDEPAGVYICYGIPKFKIRDFLDALRRLNYNHNELLQDNTDNAAYREQLDEENSTDVPGLQITERKADRVAFTINLSYQLDGSSLIVTADISGIPSDASYHVQHLELLEYFGAAGANKEGYLFVPDGAGALILLNNGRQDYLPYGKRVYGVHESENLTESSLEEQRISFPVFGLKSGDQAFLAVIEGGETAAEINADVSGRLNSYNHVSAGFNVLEKGTITIGTGSRRQSKYIFSQIPNSGELSIRYNFLMGEKANYMGMAENYRNYLKERDFLTDHSLLSAGLNIELLGSLDHRRSFGGITFYNTIPMTTFDDASEILTGLKSAGIPSASIRLKGWLEGGLFHKLPGSSRIDSSLGSTSEFEDMLRLGDELGYAVYPDVSFMRVFKRGLTRSGIGLRLLNQSLSQFCAFDPATFQRDARGTAGFYLSPSSLPMMVEGFFSGTGGMSGLNRVSLGDMNLLMADYTKREPLSLDESLDINMAQLAGMSSLLDGIGLSEPLAPQLAYAERIFDFPQESSGYNILDHDIPFNALVLHGYLPYAQPPFNTAGDFTTALLRALETGSEVTILMTHEDPSLLKETEFNSFFSALHQGEEVLLKEYLEVEPFLSAVADLPITAHEQIRNGVFLVTYGGTESVMVNYNPMPVTVGAVEIGGKDFRIISSEVIK